MAHHLRSAPSYELKLTLGTCCLSFGIGLSKNLSGATPVSLDGMTAFPRRPQKVLQELLRQADRAGKQQLIRYFQELRSGALKALLTHSIKTLTSNGLAKTLTAPAFNMRVRSVSVQAAVTKITGIR
jgi:hypothetical protein